MCTNPDAHHGRLAGDDHDHRHGGGRRGRTDDADAATVTSNTADPDLTNNTATFDQLVGPVADVSIAKVALLSLGPPPVPVTNPLAVNDTFFYALTVTNHGPDDATAVTVTDPLPPGMTLTGTVPANCSVSAGTVTCTLGQRSPPGPRLRSTWM